MKFGKEFYMHLAKTIPDWRDKYLCYKPLKKLLKNLPPAPPLPLPLLRQWFLTVLYEELEKFNDFYVEKEEEFIIRFEFFGVVFLLFLVATEAIKQKLKRRIEQVKERENHNGVLTSETEFSEDMTDIRKGFVAIHGEMILLQNYSSLNFAGLVKIVKKYDKRTGELLSLPFSLLASNQPFLITEPLSRLVYECESNRETLFPPKAEVVESTAVTTVEIKHADVSNVSLIGEETAVIYQSTLAALTAIQGLKKPSSTYNPLSMSYIFGSEDDDSTGAVTAENSPRHSW
ncbi:SPX domain-containing protein 4 [Sesamum angolense]|uniref:SPX domain-containing protein 4 n=1 Tax=Sesamum angolense TaxID=2727404 RepID=A0AAE1WGW2_9LAMI|nr:SPX domain-containing protein 4 [Sesamum angolense]